MLERKAEHDAEYTAQWGVFKIITDALDQGFTKLPQEPRSFCCTREI